MHPLGEEAFIKSVMMSKMGATKLFECKVKVSKEYCRNVPLLYISETVTSYQARKRFLFEFPDSAPTHWTNAFNCWSAKLARVHLF